VAQYRRSNRTKRKDRQRRLWREGRRPRRTRKSLTRTGHRAGRANPSRSISSATIAKGLDTDSRWEATTIGNRGTGRQNRPVRGGESSQPDLGRGLSGLQLWIPARARTARNRRTGNFTVHCKTIGKRMAAKLKDVRAKLRMRMHERVQRNVQRLQQVVRGYFQYHAIPGNWARLKHSATTCRDSGTRRFGAEASALVAPARVCAGGSGQPLSLPRPTAPLVRPCHHTRNRGRRRRRRRSRGTARGGPPWGPPHVANSRR
jgi:hypothetical protein